MAQENTARVITIAATEQPQDIRLRVAAYARVSSSSDEQLNSFAAQNRYYTELISGKDNWQLVDIYADEGITGTSIEKRDDFKRMLRDCERGLIDRILVKSISRFARNTTECLETVRSLKARGVSVYFEKEGIDTGKVSGEMLTAVFASLAQAESESISKNMRWSYQKQMQMGTFIPTHLPYGYCRSDYKIAIVDAEAEIVKRIFNEYAVDHLLRDYCKRVASGAENECRGGDADGKEDRRTDHKKQNKSDYQSCHFAASFSAPRMIFISSAMLYIRKKTINAIVTVSAR